ncbi:bifunctional metallophosphatase/5'-nucleotidase [Nocardioides sp. GCM10027113]|uniref:bifunctional metallophosphatase/5'-nucleotidase n=1 Tax=unclassified Nocardioides TaxID=2615069 RepID=UPI00360C1FDA
MQLRHRRAGAISVAALAALALGASTLPTALAAQADERSSEKVYTSLAAKKKDYVKLDLLALNDFHGNLEVIPSTSSSGRINNTPAGGVAYLASLLKEERAKSRAAGARPITVAAGDLIGASPLLSAAFHDEPTIEAMNKIGLQVASVGNHEFDEGWRELRRMQRGGCLDDGDGANGQDSCPGGKDFHGAEFQYLGANVKWEDASARKRDTVFPATKIMKVRGIKVGFIGMTLEGTDKIVSQSGIEGIDFTDEVETANALVPELRKRGVRSIFVLLHEGVSPTDSSAYNDCTGVSGPALAIAEQLKPQIDAIVSGHTHQPYNCVIPDPKGQPRLLTSAASFGRMVSKLHFLIDPDTRDVVRPAAFAENMIVENGESEPAAKGLLALIDQYKTLVEPIANEVIGHIAPAGTAGDSITRTADANGGDSALGNLIADAQKADDTVVTAGGQAPVIALMNPGGIRADLVENGAGDVTYGAAFSVQPFNNFVVSMDLTGAQIRTILNEQWNGSNEASRKILQVSGLSYTWDLSEAVLAGADAIVGDVMVDHDGDASTAMVPLEDGTTYRVVANNFIADGGDSFAGFKAGTNRLVGGLDIDSLRAYLLANDPVAATPTDRISQQP